MFSWSWVLLVSAGLVLGQRTNALFAKGGGLIKNVGKQVQTRVGCVLVVDERMADQHRESRARAVR